MKLANLITTGLIATAIAACTGNNSTGTVVEEAHVDSISPNKINRLSEYDEAGKHTIGSSTYNYTYSFKSDTSLAVVINPLDYQYYDNKAKLTITQGGRNIVTKTFTKADFREYVPDAFYKTSALIGFCYNYDKEKSKDAIYFIATIGDPDISADTSYAIEIKVTSSGAITHDRLLDRETAPVNEGMTIDPAPEADEE